MLGNDKNMDNPLQGRTRKSEPGKMSLGTEAKNTKHSAETGLLLERTNWCIRRTDKSKSNSYLTWKKTDTAETCRACKHCRVRSICQNQFVNTAQKSSIKMLKRNVSFPVLDFIRRNIRPLDTRSCHLIRWIFKFCSRDDCYDCCVRNKLNGCTDHGQIGDRRSWRFHELNDRTS